MTTANPRSTCDLCDDFPDSVQVLEPLFHCYGGVNSFHGPITTLRCLDDNGLLREILATPGNKRVLIVDGGGSRRRALFGDQLAGRALSNNWAGVLINGAVRDVAALSGSPIGVFALCAVPMRGGRQGSGEVDVEVRFAGASLKPGAMLYADANGIIVADRPLV